MLKNVCRNFDKTVEDGNELQKDPDEAEIAERQPETVLTKNILEDAAFLDLVDKIAQEYKKKEAWIFYQSTIERTIKGSTNSQIVQYRLNRRQQFLNKSKEQHAAKW